MKKTIPFSIFFAIFILGVSIVFGQTLEEETTIENTTSSDEIIQEKILNTEETFTENEFDIITYEDTRTESQKIAEEISTSTQILTDKDIEISIEKIKSTETAITVLVEATLYGKQLGFGSKGNIETEKVTFHNPSTLAPNGAIHKECNEKGDCFMHEQMSENPSLAFEMMITQFVNQFAKQDGHVIEGSIGNSTDVFFPSMDGNGIRQSVNEPFTNIRSGTGNDNDNGADNIVGGVDANSGASNYKNMWRYVVLFDTSSLPDDQTITSATLSLYDSNSKADTFATTPTYVVVSSNPASTSTIASADYQTRGSTALSNYIAFAVSQYNVLTLNAAGIALINNAGITKLGTTINWDLDNTPPAWSTDKRSYRYIRSADYAGTTYDPILTVVHEFVDVSDNITNYYFPKSSSPFVPLALLGTLVIIYITLWNKKHA